MGTIRLFCFVVMLSILFVPMLYAGPRPSPMQGSTPLHFTNNPDRMADGSGCLDGLDMGQILYSEAPDASGGPNPKDSYDYVPISADIDAISPQNAYKFDDIVAGLAELLISFVGDPSSCAVYYEDDLVSPPRGCKWSQEEIVSSCDTAGLEDLDGLNVHGPFVDNDPVFYSTMDTTGVSVYFFTGSTSNAYITRTQIYTALTSASIGFSGTESQVDVDALMVRDENLDGVWNAGDAILFSIDAAANFHGGELIYLPYGGPPSFLDHGGHLWDTNFDPALAFNIPEGAKNLDAVDSGREESGAIPTLSEWGVIVLVLLLIVTGVALLRRAQRRLAV